MKRAQLFDISMIFVVIGAMVSILLVVNTIAAEISSWKSIGQRAFELQNSYAQGDFFVNFMATAAKGGSAEVILELGKNGGLAGPTETCGAKKGVVLWNSPDAKTWCLPNAYETFYAGLQARLNAYSANYARIQQIPYEFLISEQRLLGIATVPLHLNIMAPREVAVFYYPYDFFGIWDPEKYEFPAYATGTYVFRPNFEVPFTYNLDIYKVLGRAAKTIVERCSVKTTAAEKKDCANVELIWQQDVLSEHLTIAIENDEKEQDLFYFTITQDDKKSAYFNNVAPIIKFALYLPTP